MTLTRIEFVQIWRCAAPFERIASIPTNIMVLSTNIMMLCTFWIICFDVLQIFRGAAAYGSGVVVFLQIFSISDAFKLNTNFQNHCRQYWDFTEGWLG